MEWIGVLFRCRESPGRRRRTDAVRTGIKSARGSDRFCFHARSEIVYENPYSQNSTVFGSIRPPLMDLSFLWTGNRSVLLPLLLVVGLILIGLASGCRSQSADPDDPLVYVGTGTDNPDEGIYTFRFDSTSASLRQAQETTSLLNPTFLTLAPDGQHLYSVRETTDSATVHAFDVAPSTGGLSPLNSVPAEGGAPCYISMDATGRWVLTANYRGGNVAVFPVRDDGALGPASQVVQHTGSGANPDRQSASRAHFFRVDPQNRHALAANLGTDEVRIYPFDAEQGRLDTTAVNVVSTPPGTGPRHLAFHPNGEFVYLIGELSGTIIVYDYDAELGQMRAKQTVSTVPDDFEGAIQSADIHVHPSGDFLYASNRGDANDVAAYRIEEETGRLERQGRQQDPVQWPRTFTIDPSGAYLLVANRRGDFVSVFRIDRDTGQLTDTGHSVEVPAPTKITFARSSAE